MGIGGHRMAQKEKLPRRKMKGRSNNPFNNQSRRADAHRHHLINRDLTWWLMAKKEQLMQGNFVKWEDNAVAPNLQKFFEPNETGNT